MSRNRREPYDKLIRVPEVLEQLSVSRSWLYRAVRDGVFPQPILLGSRNKGWRQSDVSGWIASNPSWQLWAESRKSRTVKGQIT